MSGYRDRFLLCPITGDFWTDPLCCRWFSLIAHIALAALARIVSIDSKVLFQRLAAVSLDGESSGHVLMTIRERVWRFRWTS